MTKRLARLTDVTGTATVPPYDPAAHGAGIVHLGLGAFHRAHQAVMTDDALAKTGGDWRIISASLRNRDVAQALAPQNGLYCVITRDADGERGRVVGAISDVIAADTDAILNALCNPAIRVVTLTVTEKGYGIDRSSGGADMANPVVCADITGHDAPNGVLGLLVAALRKRRDNGDQPFTVLCCDNLPSNGVFVRGGVIGFAHAIDPDLAQWITDHVAFPSSMVDRITPASTERTMQDAEALTGCADYAAIETEPFIQWVIEDHFPQGRPNWEAGGAVFVDNVAPYEHMKLRMLNGAHSMLAYAGFLSGHAYVRDVMANPALAALVLRHLNAAAASLAPLNGVDFHIYAQELEDRFRNPEIAHQTWQIAMDGTQKMPQRIWEPACEALKEGRDIAAFAFATAAWMHYCLGVDNDGKTYLLRDPREDEIKAAIKSLASDATGISDALHTLSNLIPTALSANTQWRQAVAVRLETMIDKGMPAAILQEK